MYEPVVPEREFRPPPLWVPAYAGTTNVRVD